MGLSDTMVKHLNKLALNYLKNGVAVRKIVEDTLCNFWFGTSSGFVKYDGEKFITFSTEVGLQDEEIIK